MPTISDVARQAGVSPATVSRVIQGAKNVSPATREKVQRVIENLGYVPSAVAQSLRSKRTRSLALVVSDITNTFWTTVARGVEDVAQRHGYSVLFCNSDENLNKQDQYLDLLISQQVDGVIIAPFDSDARHLDKLRQRSIPTVVIDRRITGWDVDSVLSDSLAGARALVQHLIGLGHEQIAIVSGPATTSTAEDRVAGYCMALSEAGLPLDPSLIKRGEFRSVSGESLAQQLLDENPRLAAVFAANNVIAMGIIDALGERGLRVPQDVALVCFDDLPNVSHLYPFLTVVAQPVYDMGVNAAQLLLSRLASDVPLRPRHVTLPVRLIVRHSCGSQMKENGECPLSLPIPRRDLGPSTMVKPLSPEERRDLSERLAGITTSAPSRMGRLEYSDMSDVNRLLAVLQHREADRVPHLEFWVANRAVYEYVLEHELETDATFAGNGGLRIMPEDQVEFALRLGMDAVPCDFCWQPRGGDPDHLEPAPSLMDQLSYLERYLRAAQGTGVGVIARFSSFFGPALAAAGIVDARQEFDARRAVLVRLMDLLLARQERVMRVVCDRFAEDLALVMVCENLATRDGPIIDLDAFREVFPYRLDRMVAAAKEHGKLMLMHSPGNLDEFLPMLHEIGFDAIHPLDPECHDVLQVRAQYAGRMAVVGAMPTSLLVHGSQSEIEEKVRELCVRLAQGGGYVLSSSGGITANVPPPNYVAMTQAVHRYGRYGSLGQGDMDVVAPLLRDTR